MESYKVSIKPAAFKELERLPKQMLRRVAAKIESLSKNPRPFGSQKLSGEEKYRLRQGAYRIVYGIDDGARIVDVVKISHRRQTYR